MNNSPLFSFERNRYYVGKMLTSADFQAEQEYMNHKRRFLNNMMFGSGIVCGCSVFSLDDLAVLVESGAAIDGLGREIIIDSAVVKKLSAMEGFEQLQTNRASLCLRYQEDKVQSVYALHKQEGKEEYEFNRIREGYELYLVDSNLIQKEFELESEFLVTGNLLNSPSYRVDVKMPATVCKGQEVKVLLRAEKLSHEAETLSYKGILQAPAFDTGDAEHKLNMMFENLKLDYGKSFEKEYWIKAQDMETQDTDVVLKNNSGEAILDGSSIEANQNISLKIVISDSKPRELVAKEVGKMNLEMRNLGKARDYIHLADVKLVRTESAYMIEEIIEKDIKRYIPAPAQEAVKSEYSEYFRGTGRETDQKELPEKEKPSGKEQAVKRAVPKIATGTLEIPLGDEAKKGDIRYSGEIMHGLGKGSVYVEIGYEFLEEDRAVGANIKNTVYGNQDLFKRDKYTLPDIETAVKVLNDKGSFIAAVKMKEEVNYLVLRFRWVAMRFPSRDDLGMTEDFKGKSIEAETPTVVLGTKESHYFAVKYTNLESLSISYELTESRSGEISADGVYTAPNKPGVYEIRIYCTDMPIICTYAYAIVKKGPRGIEE